MMRPIERSNPSEEKDLARNAVQLNVAAFIAIVAVIKLSVLQKSASVENTPCAARKSSAGYVCVCNATYCDTIERPTELPRGSYLHYISAKESPGFTMSTGSFINATDIPGESFNGVVLQVDSSVKYQTFEGVGAGLTVSSALAISSLPAEARQRLIESFFAPSGIEFSFIRVPIGSSDFSPHYSSYDDIPGDSELKYFNLTEDDYRYKIPLLNMAKNVSKRGIKLFGVAWTAPHWMKTNNDMRGGYIKNDYLGVWAHYLLKFLQSYKSFGLDFWGLSEGNQLMIYWMLRLPIPSLMMSPQQARVFTRKNLGPLLKNSGFDNINIFALEDQRPFTLWYFDRICADKQTEQYVDGVALHWYFDNDVNVHLLDEFHKKYPNKLIIYSESSVNRFLGFELPKIGSGDWQIAVIYLNNIFQNLNHWVGGYLDWNIALDENGGPAGFLNSTMDTQIIINTTAGEFYKQPVHYVMGHFSKFITPGAKIINVTVDDTVTRNRRSFNDPEPTRKPFIISSHIMAVAALNPDGGHVVIAYNPHPHSVNVVLVDLGVGVINQTVQANSLNTFLYW